MTKIKIEVEIDLNDKVQSTALSSLIQALEGGSVEPVKEEKPAPKKRAPKKVKPEEPKVKPEEPKVKPEEPKEEPEEPKEEPKEAEIEFSTVRQLMARKLQEGSEETREACIKKLGELGAKTLPDLSQEDYKGFIEFLITL